MADTRALPVFGFTDDASQLRDLRGYIIKQGAAIDPNGPAELAANLLEIVNNVHVVGATAEADMILSSISSLFVAVPEDKALQVVSALCDKITPSHFKGRGWGSAGGAAVRVLSNLFRGFAKHATIQERIFVALLRMCEETRLIGTVDTSQATLNEYLKTWGTNVDGRRNILRLLHAALLADNKADLAAKVMISLLDTYTVADAASAVEDARECVRTAVVDPSSFSFDHILGLSAVQQLEKSDPLMHAALSLFSTGMLRDYIAFVSAHPAFVSDKLRVQEEILVKKMRLLTLMSIAEKSQTVPLSELSRELSIQDTQELEEFLIEAMQVNAISGKLNEQSSCLHVSSFQHRSFGREQWKSLQIRIKSLIASVKESNENIKSVNQATLVH